MIKKSLFIVMAFMSMYSSCEEPYAQRSLLILLDESELLQKDVWNLNNFSALSLNLLDALEEKVPILTTASLFNNILVARQAFYDFATLPLADIRNKYKEPPQNDPYNLMDYKQTIEKMYLAINWTNNTIKQYLKNNPKKSAYEAAEYVNRQFKGDEIESSTAFLVAATSSFDPSEWICKQASQGMYLFIPRKYYEKDIPELITYNEATTKQQKNLTELELKLGIKIDHMPAISQSMLTTASMQQMPHYQFNLSEVFVTKQEYAQAALVFNKQIMPPTWAMYLVGHGTVPTSVDDFIQAASANEEKIFFQNLKKQGFTSLSYLADFSIFELRKFLDFLASKLRTTLFMIDACYVGGQNIAAIVDNFGKSITEKIYPFTIIAGGIAQAPTMYLNNILALPPDLDPDTIDLKKMRIVNEPVIKVSKFFTMLRTQGTVDYLELIKTIRVFKGRTISEITDLPQIKLAGLPWSQAIDIPGKVISIQNILAATYKGELDISTFFGGRLVQNQQGRLIREKLIYPEVLLLYAEKIPFSLKISKNPRGQHLAIISMIPQEAAHSIEKINAPEFTFSEIVSAFFTLKDLDTEKIFYIKEIITLDYPSGIFNVFVVNNAPHKGKGHDVNGVYFTFKNQQYAVTWDTGQPAPENPEHLMRHVSYLRNWKTYILYNFPQKISEIEQAVQEIEKTLQKNPPEAHLLNENLRSLSQSLVTFTTILGKT